MNAIKKSFRATLVAGTRCICCLRPKDPRSFPICDDCCKAHKRKS